MAGGVGRRGPDPEASTAIFALKVRLRDRVPPGEPERQAVAFGEAARAPERSGNGELSDVTGQRHAAQVVRVREPELARGRAGGGDGRWSQDGWRRREGGNHPLRRDTRDATGGADCWPGFCDPEIAVGPGCDAERTPAARRQRELGDVPGRCDAADLVARRLSE